MNILEKGIEMFMNCRLLEEEPLLLNESGIRIIGQEEAQDWEQKPEVEKNGNIISPTDATGMQVFDVNVPVFESLLVPAVLYVALKPVAIVSSMIVEGKVVPCSVIKTANSFCLMYGNPKEETIALQWIMRSFDMIHKVRGADGNVYLDIVVTDEVESKQLRVPAASLTETGLPMLQKYNIAYDTAFKRTISIFLQKIAEKMPMENAAQQLGLVKDISTNYFSFNCYTEAGFEVRNGYETQKEYLEHLNELIEPSASIQYLLSATMAAPILTLLQQKYRCNLKSYTINIVGNSSTGKTITQRLCASMWCDPNDDRIFSAMLSTGNAALKRLSGRFGLPTLLDEATITGGVKPEEFAYSVAEEREKRRLNSDCSEKASGTWSTIVVMSSESHFHDTSRCQNGGMAVRVHAMENLSFTSSKEHAEEISWFASRNFGIVGKLFTDYLLSGKAGNLEQRYATAVKDMENFCKEHKSGYTDRLVKTYALTLTAAKLLLEIGVKIDRDAVAEIMAEHNAMVASEQNLAGNAFRAIVAYRTRNPYSCGIREFKGDNAVTAIAVEDSLMCDLLTKAGFHDVKVVMKELDKAGYLLRQGKGAGLKSKLTINGNICYCYKIDLNSLNEDVEPECEGMQEEEDERGYSYL